MLYDAEKLAQFMGPDAPPLEHLRSLGEGVLPDALSDGRLMAIRRACSEASMHCPPFHKLQKSLARAVRDAVHRPRSEYEPDILKLLAERFEHYDDLSVTPGGPDAAWRITENEALRTVVKRVAREARTTPEEAFPAFKAAAREALEQQARRQEELRAFEEARRKEAALERDRSLLRAAGVRTGADAIRLLHSRRDLDSETAAAVGRLWEKAQRETERNPLVPLLAALELAARELHEGA